MAPTTGDVIGHKRWSDAFVGTTLQRELECRDVGHLVITGAKRSIALTQRCVAASLGYDVTLVADGHTTSDSSLLARQQIIAHHNRTLPRLARVGLHIAAT